MKLTEEQERLLKVVRHNFRDILVGHGICPKCQRWQLQKGFKLCSYCRDRDRDRRHNAKVDTNS